MVWVETLAGAYTGALLTVLLEVLADNAPKRWNYFQRTKLDMKQLQELEELLLRVEKVLGDAEEKQITNSSVQTWLENLKDVAYDAEDLLDAIASTEEIEQQINDVNKRLEDVIQKLKLRAQQIDVLGLKEGHGGKSFPILPTTSLVDESEVCLRNDCKEQILASLLSADVNGRKEIPVIAITGMGGIGKTTLAQFLYNDDRVKNYFNLRAWASISAEFDVIKVTKTIYESSTLSHSDIEDLNTLQVTLERKLSGRKFLLVLDNVWNVSFKEWDLLRRPLQAAVPGSKIIVTTRSQDVSSTMHSVPVHNLEPLSEEACLSLFEKHAFGGEEGDSSLKEIGENIVKKCNGLPLAVKTLGGLLRSKREAEEWYTILNTKIWNLPEHKSDILPALRLSYHHLPSHLKRCFAYCSIFPKGSKFGKRNLVRLWIAEGLVQQSNSRTRMEEVGEQYFDELISRSIFQQSGDSNGSSFIMHDLVNDLAQYVAGEFCFKYKDDSSPRNPERVRHLSFEAKPDPAMFLAFRGRNKGLRTFLPLRSSERGKPPFNCLVEDFLRESSYLRVLSLSPYLLPQLPTASICNLKQLRYLDLSGTEIKSLDGVASLYNLETLKLSRCNCLTQLPTDVGNLTKLGYLDLSHTEISFLPEGICSLHNLEALLLSRCWCLTQLPVGMERLTRLKHLDIKGTGIQKMPPNFGNLKRLQLLTNFFVGNDESSSCISELKNLSLLCESLSILQLQNVSVVEDAAHASLKDKKYLSGLIFEWSDESALQNGNAQNAADDLQNARLVAERRAEHAANVLDKLHPGGDLEKLEIINFCGMNFPRWLGNASFSKMKSLYLNNCKNCNSLPPLGQLPSLKQLTIQGLAGVQRVGRDFYGDGVVAFESLVTLHFQGMENWEEWETGFANEFNFFPSLQQLFLIECQELTGNLPTQLPSLKVLNINGCDRLRLLHPGTINPYSQLEEIDIRKCASLQSFSVDSLSKLEILRVDECRSLAPFSRRTLESLQNPNDSYIPDSLIHD